MKIHSLFLFSLFGAKGLVIAQEVRPSPSPSPSQSQQFSGGHELLAQPAEVFVLNDFTTADRVEIPVAGYLKNWSQKFKGVSVEVDQKKKTIRLTLNIEEFEVQASRDIAKQGLKTFVGVAVIKSSLPKGVYKVFLGDQEQGELLISPLNAENGLRKNLPYVRSSSIKEDLLTVEFILPNLSYKLSEKIDSQVSEQGRIWVLNPQLVKNEKLQDKKNVLVQEKIELPTEVQNYRNQQKKPFLIYIRSGQYSPVIDSFIIQGAIQVVFP
jgi:hypothetical protein